MSQSAASPQIADELLSEFSLLGGPLQRLGRRLGLVRPGPNTLPLGIALGLVPWIVLVALAALEGDRGKFFTLSVIGGHIRLLAVIPLLFFCETTFDRHAREFLSTLLRSGVASRTTLPALQAEVRSLARWSNSWIPDATSLAATVLMFLFAAQLHLSGKTASPESGRALALMPLAGLWYWMVCLPLFRFLAFRWVWRLAFWWRFLWRLARMELHLTPTHPDGVGGLGYLEVVQNHLAPLAFAISLLVAAGFAEEMSEGASFDPIYLATAITVIIDVVLFLGPPCFFAFKLMECRERGLRDYTVLAARYVEDFERKWFREASPDREPLLGTPDLQSLADLGNSVGVVRNMRLAPVSIRLLAIILAAALLPMPPLFLFKYPVAEMAQKLFMKLTGL
ncbi:hypothetical protein C5688_09505 [Methylocystis sp. MitZ-2018]|nr:hypothetical protein C5688_09505 [Methylocystis sp. MitZ-2018]